MAQSEPIFQENKDRFVIFPVKHHDIWDWYKKMETSFRTAPGIDLQQDLPEWNQKLTADERNFIKHLLTFFATSNGTGNLTFTEKFLNQVQYPEAKFFYGSQVMMENIHFETCSLLIKTYLENEQEKKHFFERITGLPAFQNKTQWILKSAKSDSFAERLIAFAALQRFFCSGAFSCTHLLKKQGIMPTLTSSSENIAKDKALHSGFAVHLHNNHLINKVPKERIKEIVLEAFEIEKVFIAESIPVDAIGLDIHLVTQHLKFVADELLTELKCEKEFGAANPFIQEDNHDERTSLIQKRAGEFQKSAIKGQDKDPDKIKFDADLS